MLLEGAGDLAAPETVYAASYFVDIVFSTDFIFKSPEISGFIGFAIHFSMGKQNLRKISKK